MERRHTIAIVIAFIPPLGEVRWGSHSCTYTRCTRVDIPVSTS